MIKWPPRVFRQNGTALDVSQKNKTQAKAHKAPKTNKKQEEKKTRSGERVFKYCTNSENMLQ